MRTILVAGLAAMLQATRFSATHLAAAAPLSTRRSESAYAVAHRFSASAIVALHVGIFALLAALDVLPLPEPLSTLIVHLVPPPSASLPEITPPRPQPVERKPVPRPQPAPRQLPQMLAAQTEAASVAATETPAPVVRETPPPPAPAPPPTLTQARFDADYLQNPAPAYPALSRRMGEEGKIVLRVFVEPSGRPSQIELKSGSGSPRLDQAAQDAVWRWKFVAVRRGDEAIGAWVLVPIVFNLRS